jgi:glycosyltransferase involved in cell wall biosynthesis
MRDQIPTESPEINTCNGSHRTDNLIKELVSCDEIFTYPLSLFTNENFDKTIALLASGEIPPPACSPLADYKEDLSVVLPAYNHERTIRDALNSILMQETSYKYVVYCLNDASTDGTEDIISEYVNKYPGVVVKFGSLVNQGSGKGSIYHNKPDVNGKYWCILEGDDFWIEKKKIQQQIDFLNSQSDFVGCGSFTVVKNEISGEISAMRPQPTEWNIFHLLNNGTYVHPSSIIWRNIYKGKGFFLPPFFKNPMSKGDSYLTHLMLCSGENMKIFPEFWSCYRYTGTGIWSTKTPEEQANLNKELLENIDSSIRERLTLLLKFQKVIDFIPRSKI